MKLEKILSIMKLEKILKPQERIKYSIRNVLKNVVITMDGAR